MKAAKLHSRRSCRSQVLANGGFCEWPIVSCQECTRDHDDDEHSTRDHKEFAGSSAEARTCV